ncbi:MAG TPA: carbohydrate porin [Candidatus Binatia bacterium]|nr:carbohydrate porin [Candidatus Binatia bacterium]
MVEYWNSGIVNGLLQQLGVLSSIIPTFSFSIPPFFHRFILPIFLYSIFLGMVISAVAYAQANPPSSVRCPSPADPRNLHFECVGQPFDFIEETLTKNWAGLRGELNRLGIAPTASYTAQLLGNPGGGQSRGFTYAGTLQTSIYWDLDKLLRLPGLSFNIDAAWSTGKNLSAGYIGNNFWVQSAYTAPGNGTNNLTLGPMYLQQQLFDRSLIFAAGRLAAANTFATMPVLNNYLNVGINPAPGALDINDVAFTSYPPGVVWGAQAIYNLTPVFQVAAGVFNTNQNSALGGKGGLNFDLQQGNRGVLTVVQVNYFLNHAPDDKGLPGQYSFGGFYDGNRLTNLNNPNSTKQGIYSIYGMFQQMVYRDGEAGSQKGLTIWGETALAPRSTVSFMPYFVGGGLSYQGAIPRREGDIASVGLIYGTFSRYIPRTTAETVIEANYQVTLTNWLSITPDIQYVIRPGGSSAIGNALVLGTQLAISF